MEKSQQHSRTLQPYNSSPLRYSPSTDSCIYSLVRTLAKETKTNKKNKKNKTESGNGEKAKGKAKAKNKSGKSKPSKAAKGKKERKGKSSRRPSDPAAAEQASEKPTQKKVANSDLSTKGSRIHSSFSFLCEFKYTPSVWLSI